MLQGNGNPIDFELNSLYNPPTVVGLINNLEFDDNKELLTKSLSLLQGQSGMETTTLSSKVSWQKTSRTSGKTRILHLLVSCSFLLADFLAVLTPNLQATSLKLI